MYPMVPGSTVTLERGKDGMVGLTIGGGAPYCPCLYVVQVTRPPQLPLDLSFLKISSTRNNWSSQIVQYI